MKIFAFVLILLLLLTACTTAKKYTITVDYPANITRAEARAGTVMAFSGNSKEWSNVEKIVDNALSAGLNFYLSPRDASGWAVESVSEDIVEMGFPWRSHYLRCGIIYQDKSCNLKILSSNNLSESKNRIHRKALALMDRLEISLRKVFGQMSASKAQNKDIPTVQPTE
ncbi:MAG: hypothetical protein AB1611_17420 [bacterium]